MGIFTKAETPIAASKPNYYFLENIAPTLSPEQAAHLQAVAQALKAKPLAVLSGGLDPRAEANFDLYRDKGHFFAKGTQHQNFFAELHGHSRKDMAKITALPLAGYIDGLTPHEDYAHSATLYNDDQGQSVFRVSRDEAGKVTEITYFGDRRPIRIDSYDAHQRLLMSQQFGAVANQARIQAHDSRTVHGLMARTLYDEDGKPVFAQTYSPEQLWLLNAQAVPARLFKTEAAMMAWWLMQQLSFDNHIYLAADSPIFAQLASYEKLRPHLVPIVQDPLSKDVFTGMHFSEMLVNDVLIKDDFSGIAAKVTPMPSWRQFTLRRSWSVFARS